MFDKKQSGSEPSDDKDKTSIPEQKEAEEERKRGGKVHHHARKRGGHVPGHKSGHRPDKRARGGGTGADMHPESSAGKMSGMDYEGGKRTNRDEEGAGKGGDKNAKGFD
jgi:hypothetical protein